jgi:predicted ATPase
MQAIRSVSTRAPGTKGVSHCRLYPRHLTLQIKAVELGLIPGSFGGYGEAFELLASVYGRFTEGFTTADLKAAKALIEELRQD